MADQTIALSPFSVPQFVVTRFAAGKRQDGFTPSPRLTLSQVDADVLAQMCDEFRAAVFATAGKPDPWLRGRTR